MRMLRCALAGFTLSLLFAAASPASAKTPAAAPAAAVDLAAMEACLKTQKDATADRGFCMGKVMDPCMQVPGGDTTYGMMDCQKREIAVWDLKLNQTYQALLKDGSARLKTTLKAAQRAWIEDRDKTCLIPYAYFEGGTIAGPMGGSCMNEMTAERFLFLDDYLHYAE
jgi:uncharacterized protein YecT (DUF1311 family)